MRSTTGILAALCLAAWATAAVAGDDWDPVAKKLQASGGAKEVEVNQSVKHILIKVKDGEVIIQTLVVRQGGNKTPYPVGRRMAKGEHHIIDLPERVMVTGFRISDGGGGRYEVHVRK